MKAKPTYEELERRVLELEKTEAKYKHCKKAFQESDNLYKRLFEQAPLGYQSLDENGHLLIVNQTWLDILGYTQDEVIGKYFADFLQPRWRDHFNENFSRFKSIGETQGLEFEMVKKNTDLILVAFTGKIGRNRKGDFQQTHCIFHDITERKRAEEQLRERNKRLESFLQVSRRITPASSKSELMQAIVDNATRASNLCSGALYLLSEQDTIYLAATVPALPENFPGKFRQAFLHDHPHIKEAVKSGRHILIEDARNATLTPAEREILQLRNLRSNLYLPIRSEDHSIGVLILSSVKVKHRFSEEEISLLQDFAQQAAQVYENVRIYEHANQHARELEQEIAERKQAELEKEKLQAQLNQAQKMESVGRLAGGVAHDFNNMLGVILGHAEMSLEEIDPEAPLYATLQAVQHAAERSAALTRQLLAFARKQTVAPKVIDINETVAGMLNMLRRLIGEDIDLLWQPGEKLSPVKVDPSQIDQLLANLCVNARDAIDGVGKITIETQPATFDQRYCSAHHGYLPGEYILLAVSDDGCGMDQDTLNHIFEPFFTTKEQGKGTGLGLASVFGMVRQNNGFINVYSESGRGTTFKIYLPIFAVTSARVATKAPDMPAERGNETILLVEDEPAILQMTTMMLERLGYTVVAAATPGEAIRLAHEYRGRVDLLMTDVVMPEMNGRDLAKNLLLINPKLNRLFMSGYTANVIAHHGVLDEGVHFIQKPFSVKELSGKVREVLNGN